LTEAIVTTFRDRATALMGRPPFTFGLVVIANLAALFKASGCLSQSPAFAEDATIIWFILVALGLGASNTDLTGLTCMRRQFA
jgi:hypothetical protein